jgi:hypothetical protein
MPLPHWMTSIHTPKCSTVNFVHGVHLTLNFIKDEKNSVANARMSDRLSFHELSDFRHMIAFHRITTGLNPHECSLITVCMPIENGYRADMMPKTGV